jgi:hypothetical protein
MNADLRYPQDMSNGAEEIVEFGPFRLLLATRRLERDGKPVEIGGRALDVLVELVRQAGRVVSKADLMSTVWGNAIMPTPLLLPRESRRRFKTPGAAMATVRNGVLVCGRVRDTSIRSTARIARRSDKYTMEYAKTPLAQRGPARAPRPQPARTRNNAPSVRAEIAKANPATCALASPKLTLTSSAV